MEFDMFEGNFSYKSSGEIFNEVRDVSVDI